MFNRILFTLIIATTATGCSDCRFRWPTGGGLPMDTPRPIPPPPGATYNCGPSDNVFTVYLVQVGAAACDLGIPVQVRAPSLELARSCPRVYGAQGLAFAYPGYPSPPTARGVCRGSGLYSHREPINHHDTSRAVECVRQVDVANGGTGIGWSSC